MTFFPLSVVVHPEFIPFQSIYVQVRPGCETCRFRVISLKPTTNIHVDVYEPVYSGEGSGPGANMGADERLFRDIENPDSQFVNGEVGPLSTSDCELWVSGLKPGHLYTYQVATNPGDPNGYARVVGHFHTNKREASLITDRLIIRKAGDPGEGELYIRFGILDALAQNKELSYVEWPRGGGSGSVEDGRQFNGSEFQAVQRDPAGIQPDSKSSEVKGVLSGNYARVVIYARDDDSADLDYIAAHIFSGPSGLSQGGTGEHPYGTDIGAPAAKGSGTKEGNWTEWVREVQDFLNLPKYPGTYRYPVKLDTFWGVELAYEGELIIEVTSSGRVTQFDWPEYWAGTFALQPRWSYSRDPDEMSLPFHWPEGANLRLPKWPYIKRAEQTSLPLERGRLLLRMEGNGEISAGRRMEAKKQYWRRLPGLEAHTLVAFANGADTVILAATSANGKLMLGQGTLGSGHALLDLRWVSTDEICASPVMPVNDGDRLLALMFVDREKSVRLLPLSEKLVSKIAPKSIHRGQNATKVWPVYEDGAIFYFALDQNGALSYHRHNLLPDKTKEEKGVDIGEGVHGFAVVHSRGQAHVFAVSKDRGLRLLSIALHSPPHSVLRKWHPFGTLDSPGVPRTG